LANGRYAAGVGNPIEVTDSLVALANARTAHVAALYNYKIAQASMEKAMGVR
jgi:outer membrane protein TolC